MSDVVILLKMKNQYVDCRYGVYLYTLCDCSNNKVSLMLADIAPLMKLFEEHLFCFELTKSEVVMKCAIAGYQVFEYKTLCEAAPDGFVDEPRDAFERLA